MKNLNSVLALKSGFYYAIASAFSGFTTLLTTSYFSRIMSVETYGDFNNFLSWFNVISVLFMNLGSSLIVAKSDKLIDYMSFKKSINNLLAFLLIVMLLVTNIAGEKALKNIFGLNLLFANILVIYAYCNQAFQIFQIDERFSFRYKKSVSMIIVSTVVSVVMSYIFVNYLSDQFLGRVLGLCIPTAVCGIYSAYSIFRNKTQFYLKYCKRAIIVCIPFIPHVLSLTLLNSSDKIMIMSFCGNKETAFYSLAYACASIVSFFVGVLNNTYAPWLVNQINLDNGKFIKKITKFYVIGFELLITCLVLLSPEIIFILGGERYFETSNICASLMLGASMQLVYTIYVNLEQIFQKTVYMAIGSVIVALINIFLNYLFIPVLGYKIAAFTTLVSYFFLAVFHMYIINKILKSYIVDSKISILAILHNLVLGMTLYFFSNVIFDNYIRCTLLSVLLIAIFVFTFKVKVELYNDVGI